MYPKFTKLMQNTSSVACISWHQIQVNKVKVTFHPRTDHEGLEAEWRYSSALSSTSALDGGGCSTPHLGHFIIGKETWWMLYRRLSGPRAGIWHQIDVTSVYFAFRFRQCLWVYDVFVYSLNTRRPRKQSCVGNCESSESVPMLPEALEQLRSALSA
jgi:hypothetical protein